MRSLEGLRVLDVTHVMAGSFCSMVLADMGADVVKVERPPHGDPMRGAAKSGFRPFTAVNRNKRGLAIDLATRAGSETLVRMAEQADVLVENFRPGTLGRFGLGHDDLLRRNPRLIYCSISGFGSTGPYGDRGGFDLVAQAMSGIMSVTGEGGRPPVKVGVPIADLNAGLYGAFGVVCAVVHRQQTGVGQFVDTSLYEGALAYTVWESGLFFATGEVSKPEGSAHRLSAPYEAVRTADGWIVVGAANQANWERLCTAIRRPDLVSDERFARGGDRLARRAELAEVLEAELGGGPTAHWVETLLAAGVPCGPIHTIDEAVADPQTVARDMVVDIDGGRYLGVPVKLSKTPGAVTRPPPQLGEHNDEVLAEYGFTVPEIADLRAAAVITP